jgi:geranylgeranyl diphosphate synthase type I
MNELLQSKTDQMIPAVETEMQDVLKLRSQKGDPFYGMMHYHMGWVDQDFKLNKIKAGKRIRPLLCLLSTEAAGADWESAVPGAASIEILHNFTLVHDDIQDVSPTRRGRPTVWRLWGENLAINSGDAMFAIAHLAMNRLSERGVPDAITVQALRRLDETCVDLTIGQHADMSFEIRNDVTVEEYLRMIHGKTAALLAFSTELGALVADCPPEIVKHYADFGRDLGFAFQIRDDILGIWGDETKLGKSSATDIETRKKSLPVLYGLRNSSRLEELYAQETNDANFVQEVVEELDKVDARKIAESYEERYANSALEHWKAANPKGDAGLALHQLTLTLLNRQT